MASCTLQNMRSQPKANVLDMDWVMRGDFYEEDRLWYLERPTGLRTSIPVNGSLNLWTLADREARRVGRAKRLPPVVFRQRHVPSAPRDRPTGKPAAHDEPY